MNAPRGAYVDKLWREALRKAVLKRVENEQRLDRIAEQVVSKAETGDLVAAKEIGDRLDGKAAQAIQHQGHDGEALVITWQPQS